MTKLTVGILCGGTSGEHEVSLLSAYNIQQALNREKYEVVLVGIDTHGGWFLGHDAEFLIDIQDVRKAHLDTSVPVARPGSQDMLPSGLGAALSGVDLFFPITHGKQGEDGALQGLLELLGKPYVGCDVTGSAICMDKDISKRLLHAEGIPVSNVCTIRNPESVPYDEVVATLGTPLFVKPAREGSSLGVSKVWNAAQYEEALRIAFALDRKVLVEEAVLGREIECAVLGNERPTAARVLGEIVPRHEFYSYEAKYVDEHGAELIVPAPVAPESAEQIRAVAVQAFQATECQGMARVDFFLREDGSFVLNELNTLPGFTNISMYPRLWIESGVSYHELLDRLIALALETRQ
ncbi:MAG: D-alanine--D-alanine ligase family protein [SAR324 cluster bacterium]|nr:D-alanine--D-alanine ligase family protein [SAR324 cluster bacterium]